MSIIYEALKKAEKIISRDALRNPDKPAKSRLKSFLSYLLALSILLFTANTLFIFLTWPKNKKTLPAPLVDNEEKQLKYVEASAANETLAPQASSPDTIKEEAKLPPRLVLSGVFYTRGEEGYALINNQIVRIGDVIEGAKLTRINPPDEVELDSPQGKIKLSTRSR